MPAHLTHVDGSMEEASVEALEALLAELDTADDEHPDVAAAHESGWTLSVFQSGKIVWENVEEDGAPRHIDGLDRSMILTLLTAVVNGDLEEVEAASWMPGY